MCGDCLGINNTSSQLVLRKKRNKISIQCSNTNIKYQFECFDVLKVAKGEVYELILTLTVNIISRAHTGLNSQNKRNNQGHHM